VSDFTKEDAQWAKQVITCREIVKSINDFGVTDFQRIKIIELIGLELEKREDSLAVTEVAKKLLESRESDTNQQRRILT
jgi:hypothetical protein